ncbi:MULTISPECIES: CBS and ACT domain-containing protein [Oceanithermus]|uniref:Acetoin dehydrogenase n=3 Tax=Oceanithermus TaxID=208447 RepID=A0A511RGQ5_9DEIN|nr:MULTISPECIES: CBS and ACT domain-containing protein [Oceanithermus]MBB6028782.1 acetoin utilization protein AcuB [Oceanithermus desulfurans]GEM88841.1 acetoin dehydrogenase [Oceanithermus desulfurans NBRC 100063]
MLVRDVMHSPVITISTGATLEEANALMWEQGIRHLPVVEGGRIVGILTDRDVRLATSELSPMPFTPQARVEEVMNTPVLTADPLDPVEEAARVMRDRKIGCLPVVDGRELVGIITGIDLLDALVALTGARLPSGRVEVRLPDRPGKLAKLAAFFAERGVNIHSLLTYPDEPGWVRNVLRVGSLETRKLADELRAAGFEVLWPPEKPWSR